MSSSTKRVPFTIKVAMSIWLIFMVLQALAIAAVLAGERIYPGEMAWRIAVLCGLGYQVYAAGRLSRWSLLVHTLVYGSVTVRRYLHDPDWTQHYPILGVFVDIIPWAAIALLVAAHWRKLNWLPLGTSTKKGQSQSPSDVEHRSRSAEPSWVHALEAIKRLLRDDWDPIGMMPHLPADEYDSYAMQVFSKLKAGASTEEVAHYLSSVDMGGEPNYDRDRLVAEKAAAIVADMQRPDFR